MLSLVYLIISLGLVLSIDSLGVGFTYGVRKILIPIRSLLIIMGITGTVIFVSLSIGHGLRHFIYPDLAKMLGGLLLITLGCWNLYNLSKTSNEEKNETSTTSFSEIDKKKSTQKILGFKNLIEILRTPIKADGDRSGWISIKEAAVLGTALSLDAFGAGIGAALLGYPILLTPIVIAIMSGMFIYLGILVGAKFANLKWISQLHFLPGCLLIIMGIYKFF